MTRLKSSLSEYTESEFLEFIKEIWAAAGTEEYQDELLEHFIDVTGCAAASDWIYYPESADQDSPEGVIAKVKTWRIANGFSDFKRE